MEEIALLEAVVSTMDTISISGVDNQDKFVGCANAIRTVIRKLRQARTEHCTPAAMERKEEEADG